MIKLVVAGAAGRMGSSIIEMAREGNYFKVVYGLESEEKNTSANDFGADVTKIAQADVVIDFTSPQASLAIASAVAKYKKPIVIGTTGFTPVQEEELKELLRAVPVLKSANMSLAVNVLFKLAREAARVLKAYHVKIDETHHVHKKDKPSGTALRIGEEMQDLIESKIEYQSKREGEVVGDHKVVFDSPFDTLELFHQAKNSALFAGGALFASDWLVKQKPGFYTMQDALELK
jgi:4-hydroxy-tetrahydrodipicolinate reductase